MIIEDCRSNAKQFESIKLGECFEFNDEFYIKIGVSSHPHNAFSLTYNTTGYFTAKDFVTLVNAKVVIE